MHTTSQAGAALLLALATTVLIAVTGASLARLATTARVQRDMSRRNAIADDLLRQVEPPIQHWLARAEEVVLPEEAEEPRVVVLRETWTAGALRCELAVTAWDQCGLVPYALARAGSPLRLTLPDEVRALLDRARLPAGQPPGLDVFDERGTAPGPYPPSSRTGSTTLALGALVATHNHRSCNVATAPLPLVEQALRLAGRGGLQQIRAARRAGKKPPIAGSAGRNARRGTPQIVAESDAWAFRIDIQVGALRRSFWSVYTGGASNWRCVQRLVLPH